MSLLNPLGTTAGDIALAALQESRAVGEGMTASSTQITNAIVRLQWLLIEWQRQRQLVYHLEDFSVTSTGAQFYTIGPGGQLDTGANVGGLPNSARPASVQSAFIRQPQGDNPIDYPLGIIKAKEDWNRIAFKPMQGLSQWLFYDSEWPLGKLYPYPVANASIYELHVSVMQILPPSFATSGTTVNLPFEYLNGLVLNLALRLRSFYGIASGPGDLLPGLAKQALNVIRGSNLQIARLNMPAELRFRGKGYNIFSDQPG